MHTTCPQCGKRYKVADEHAGRHVRCTQCQHLFAATDDDAFAPIPLASMPDATDHTAAPSPYGTGPATPPPLPVTPPPLPPTGQGWSQQQGWSQPGYSQPVTHPVVVRHGLAYVTVALLLVYFLAMSVMEGFALDKALDDDPDNLEAATTLLGVAGGGLICLLVAIVTGLCWVYYTYRNLYAFGYQPLRFTPGSAVGWHFCPIVNLWKIPQAMSDMWIGSDPSNRGQASPVIALWICAYILNGILARLSDRELVDVPAALSILVGAVEVACHCYIILTITRFQATKQQLTATTHAYSGQY